MRTYPSLEFSSIEPASNAPDYLSESQSLKTISTSTGAQRFEFKVKSVWERLPVARALWAFLSARRTVDKFEIQLPIYDSANGVVTGVVKANANLPIGTTDITFVNYQPAIGDFIQCAGHAKVYMVEDAAGNQGTIFPPLIKSVLSAEVITVNDLKFTVRRKGKISKLKSKQNNVAQVEFTVLEAF